MNAKPDSEIHDLTMAEVDRQVKMHSERRRQIINERAAICSDAFKNGTGAENVAIDADERAAREHARNLLNGAAPESLSLPPEITRDKMLWRELRGIDIVLGILARKEIVARAAAAVAWGEEVRPKWLAGCREIVLAAIKLAAMEARMGELSAQCPDAFSVSLPLMNLIGARSLSEIPLNDLVEAALAGGVLTSVEIRKAQNVG